MYSNKYPGPGPAPPPLDNNLAINTAPGRWGPLCPPQMGLEPQGLRQPPPPPPGVGLPGTGRIYQLCSALGSLVLGRSGWIRGSRGEQRDQRGPRWLKGPQPCGYRGQRSPGSAGGLRPCTAPAAPGQWRWCRREDTHCPDRLRSACPGPASRMAGTCHKE